MMKQYVKLDVNNFVLGTFELLSQPPAEDDLVEVTNNHTNLHNFIGGDHKYKYVDGEFVQTTVPTKPPGSEYEWSQVSGEWVITDNITKLQNIKLIKVKESYGAICSGVSPDTRKQIYVDCTAGTQTFRMNAGRVAAETFDSGLRLAERSGETVTTVVDFYDNQHTAVPLDVAQQVNMQQAQDAQTHYFAYQQMKENIRRAETVSELKSLDLFFTVNTE